MKTNTLHKLRSHLFELKTECIPYRKRITNKFNEKFIVFIPKAAPGSRVSKYEVDYIK
jgi:hypothetical protein